MKLQQIARLDQLIRLKATGSPAKLAERCGVTKRMVYEYIRFMKDELKAPISYCKERESYIYTEEGNIPLKWEKK